MTTVVEDIPVQLQPAADAALLWINETQEASYKLAGLVDPDLSWQPQTGMPMDMALVLCDNETCAREQVRVQLRGDGYQIAAIAAEDALIPPHLDPPMNVRRGWLDAQMHKHKFIVLVFYRGFW